MPNTGALDAMEGQIRALAEAVEALAAQNATLSPDHLDAIDRRLDEISRAIATVSASAASRGIRHRSFRAHRGAPVRPVQPGRGNATALQSDVSKSLAEIAERLGAMHETVSRHPADNAFENLARRLDDVVQRSTAARTSDAVPAELLDNLNGRFEEIARRLDSHHASVEETGTRLFQSVDARMEELARRIDENDRDAGPVPTFDHMERRIEEIAQMLSSGDAFSPDARALETLEGQIAALTEKLSGASAADNTALADSRRVSSPSPISWRTAARA
jgi:localization factor PodJL